MQNKYVTERLLLNELTYEDAGFICELVNTSAWKKFIGDRNIKSTEDAVSYIKKIIENPNITYWVVKLKHSSVPVGIVTLIKRDYLQHHDIGFAFLPNYTKKGYACEAAIAILNDIKKDPQHKNTLAITIKENTASIKLLEKLGFQFASEIQEKNETLLIFSLYTNNI